MGVDGVKLSVFTRFLNRALQSKAWWSDPTYDVFSSIFYRHYKEDLTGFGV